MKRLAIQQVDVFTQVPFKGNPSRWCSTRRCVERADAVDRAWTNLSETTFVCCDGPAGDYRLRIFHARKELPFAGIDDRIRPRALRHGLKPRKLAGTGRASRNVAGSAETASVASILMRIGAPHTRSPVAAFRGLRPWRRARGRIRSSDGRRMEFLPGVKIRSGSRPLGVRADNVVSDRFVQARSTASARSTQRRRRAPPRLVALNAPG